MIKPRRSDRDSIFRRFQQTCNPRAPRGWRPPTLVAEVVSPRSIKRDYETKREEYLAYGLGEYWIVDPLKGEVLLLTRDGDAWREIKLREAEVIPSLVLPGWKTKVAELWTNVEVDKAEPDPPPDRFPPPA